LRKGLGLLKKETRILGLSAPKKTGTNTNLPIIGVVYRGSFWLDALLTFALDKTDKRYVTGLAATIKRSKQYSQIHAAVFSRKNILPNGFRDFTLLAEKIDMPVLVLNRPETSTPRKFMTLTNGKESTSIWSTNENLAKVKQLFSVGCTEERMIPEAVRVADLIATQL
jgi:endonuclease V-like protein UPF0215 family